MDRRKLLAKATAAIHGNDLASAKRLCGELRSRHPNDVDVLKLQSRLQFKVGDWESGAKLLRQASSLEPKNTTPWVELVEGLLSAGQEQLAWAEIQTGLRRFPSSFELNQAASRLAFQTGEDSIGLAYLAKAETFGLPDASSQRLAARALLSIGQPMEAKRRLQLAIEQFSDVEAMTFLGYVVQSEGEFDRARALFLDAIAQSPLETAAYHGYAQGRTFSEVDRGFIGSVEQLLNREDVDQTQRMALAYVVGKALEDLGDFNRAFEFYRTANESAFQVNLKGRSFDREAHARFLEESRARFSEPIDSGSLKPSHGPIPIFVVGMMRSGTSLVEQILSSHPDIEGAGELDFWPDHHRESFERENIPRLATQYTNDLQSRFPEARWVVDKMPQNTQSLGAIHLAFPGAPIIHVRRDRQDTCFSIYTTAYAVSPDFAHDLESIRFAYDEYLRMMDHWRAVLPEGRILEIDYEQLIEDRELVLRDLADRIGIGWDEALLHHESNVRMVTTPSVWQVRQPLYTGSIGRWKRFERFL